MIKDRFWLNRFDPKTVEKSDSNLFFWLFGCPMKTTDQNTVMIITQAPKLTADSEKPHIIKDLPAFIIKCNCGMSVVELAFNREAKQKNKRRLIGVNMSPSTFWNLSECVCTRSGAALWFCSNVFSLWATTPRYLTWDSSLLWKVNSQFLFPPLTRGHFSGNDFHLFDFRFRSPNRWNLISCFTTLFCYLMETGFKNPADRHKCAKCVFLKS